MYTYQMTIHYHLLPLVILGKMFEIIICEHETLNNAYFMPPIHDLNLYSIETKTHMNNNIHTYIYVIVKSLPPVLYGN